MLNQRKRIALPSRTVHTYPCRHWASRPLAAQSRYVGAERIIWASDYPHPDAKFPGTVAELLENIGGMDLPDQQAIASENARRLYRLPAPA